MELVDDNEALNVEGMFGDEDDDNEGLDALPPLSPLNANSDAAAGGDTNNPASTAKRRKTLNRLPNLNEKYITDQLGEGLYKVNSYFDKIKFKKEKDCEAANLRMILQRFEYFGQQCYPKLCFQDFTDKVEKLSKKKMIKHALECIRNEDKTNSEKVTEPENLFTAASASRDQMLFGEVENDEMIDSFGNGHGDTLADRAGERHNDSSQQISEERCNDSSQQISEERCNDSSQQISEERCNDSSPQISEEMKELIRKKRLQAMEKRKRKLEDSMTLET